MIHGLVTMSAFPALSTQAFVRVSFVFAQSIFALLFAVVFGDLAAITKEALLAQTLYLVRLIIVNTFATILAFIVEIDYFSS